ncbi:MAG: hypothetical protein SF097_14955 [Acidobacteriota bacterium]|nr:hypothetical protein [Acidobacteriota bacterium]
MFDPGKAGELYTTRRFSPSRLGKSKIFLQRAHPFLHEQMTPALILFAQLAEPGKVSLSGAKFAAHLLGKAFCVAALHQKKISVSAKFFCNGLHRFDTKNLKEKL